MQHYNRHYRRIIRAKSKDTAALMAARCTHRNDRTGQTEAVKSPLAVAVLARAFRQLIVAGGDLQMIRLTEAEAAAFPGCDVPGVHPPETKPFLAVAFDLDGRATYSIRRAFVVGATDPINERRTAEAAMFAVLRPVLDERWPDSAFQVGGAP